MNKRSLIYLILIITSLGAISNSVYAQENDPYKNNFNLHDKDPRHFDQVKETNSTLFDEKNYLEILKILYLEFKNSNETFWDDSINKDDYEKVDKAFVYFFNQLSNLIKSNPLDLSSLGGAFFKKKQATNNGKPISFFKDEFLINVEPKNISKDAAIDLIYRMDTANRVLNLITKHDREGFEIYLKNLNTQWDNFHFKAKSQYPWEFAINSFLLKNKRPIIKPPSKQLILLHPNISLELDTSDFDALKTYQVFNIELLGMAWNYNNYSDYFSVSGLLTLNNDLGNGYGGMLSWNDFQLGVVHHTSIKKTNLIITIDLIKFIQKGVTKWDNIRDY